MRYRSAAFLYGQCSAHDISAHNAAKSRTAHKSMSFLCCVLLSAAFGMVALRFGAKHREIPIDSARSLGVTCIIPEHFAHTMSVQYPQFDHHASTYPSSPIIPIIPIFPLISRALHYGSKLTSPPSSHTHHSYSSWATCPGSPRTDSHTARPSSWSQTTVPRPWLSGRTSSPSPGGCLCAVSCGCSGCIISS